MLRILMPALVGCSVFGLDARLTAQDAERLAAGVKEIFRSHCLECHGGAVTRGRIKILDRDGLVKRKVLAPGKVEDSTLYQLITSKDAEAKMPPVGQPDLKAEEIETVRRWIAAGAPAFPADAARPIEDNKEPTFKNVVGVDYVLKKILADVRATPPDQRPFVRYFSLNHILAGGATDDELERQRVAFALAVNHLSWQATLVKPRSIDAPVNSVYALDLRQLGWHVQPFQVWQHGKAAGKSPLMLFDLALLDYPYGIYYQNSEVFDHLLIEYFSVAYPVRPVPYVRMDWFTSTVTQPPLYEDFLQLPFNLQDLERHLGVDAADNVKTYVARRAGMSVSGVSRNNRVVERHPSPKGSYYWKSFDYRTSKGPDNVFLDPVNLHPAGGEFIFGLPNGLQGYFVANGKGARVDAAPTDIVTDKFASDQTVRNGLACMRCHDRGMKEFADTVRGAALRLPDQSSLDKRTILALYPEAKEMDPLVQQDRERFEAAVKNLLGKVPDASSHPLVKVSKRYLDDPIHLTTAAGELGLADAGDLSACLRLPQFVGLGLIPLAEQGAVRRDAWEDYFDLTVRQLGLGEPIVPLDGLLRTSFPAIAAPIDVALKTTKKSNIVEPGEEIAILVENKSSKTIYIELIGTSATGEKVILAPSSTIVQAGQTYRFPPNGGIKVRGGAGKEQVTLFAADWQFPPGELHRGRWVADRVVHPFYAVHRDGNRFTLRNLPNRLVKKTIDIETR